MAKIKLIFACVFLFVIILMGVFPKIFIYVSKFERSIIDQTPSLGNNTFVVYNKGKEAVFIDSLITNVKPVRGVTSLNMTLNPGDSLIVHQKLEFFRKVENKRKSRFNSLHVRLHVIGETSLKISINGNKLKKLKKMQENYVYTSLDSNSNDLKFFTILGTDTDGIDIWTRLVMGAKVILLIILYSVLISTILGTLIGILHGYYSSPIINRILSGLANLANSFSIYLLTMLVVSFTSKDIFSVTIAFSLIQWIEIEKMVYQKVLDIRKLEFIDFSFLYGKTNFQIIITDVLPHLFKTILSGASYLAKRIVLIEASLSFIGYSVTCPDSTWGSILSCNSDKQLSGAALTTFIPAAIAIVLLVASFDFIETYIEEKIKNEAHS